MMKSKPSILFAARKIISLGIAGTILISMLTGCWNRKELNELAIVLAMGIDTVDDQYELSLQVVDPSQMTRNRVSDRSPTRVYTERAPTLFEAFRKFTTMSSRKMYFSHLQFVIFDEKTAKKGIKPALDILFRDHEVRPDFHLAIARKHSAKEVMSFVTPTEVLPALDLYKSLKVSEKAWAPTAAIDVKDIMQRLTQSGIEPVLTGIELHGDLAKGISLDNVKQPGPYANYSYTGIGVFRGDRLVGWLNETDSKALTYISNEVSSTAATIQCPQSKGKFAVELTRSKIKSIPLVKENKPHIRLEVFVEANIAEVGCKVDLTNEASFTDMERAASEKLEETLLSGIHKTQQKFGSDIFGFGEAFHRKYPTLWHRWKNDWGQMFKNLPVEIQMNYNLRRIGKIISPIANNPDRKE
jgi:spore germination protein KC